MSADNGVYIGIFPNNEFRVIHVQGIDNLGYEPDGYDGFNSCEILSYFNRPGVEIFTRKEAALSRAHEIAEKNPVLEYGVSTIYFPFTINQFKNRCKNWDKVKD